MRKRCPAEVFSKFPILNIKYKYFNIRFYRMSEKELRQCKEVLEKNQMYPIKRLGKGAFGSVFLVSLEKNQKFKLNAFAAVKCINFQKKSHTPMMKECIRREIKHLSPLSHRNIVEMYRTFESNGWVFILMEYCEVGTLEMIQLQKKNGLYGLQQSLETGAEVARGIEYLHQNQIIHRDIKLQNLLKTFSEKQNRFVTKICDFGFSKSSNNDQLAKTFCGTGYYMAPQMLNKNQYGATVDVWSLGVVLFKMIFGMFPFRGYNIALEIQKKATPLYILDKKIIQSGKYSEIDDISFKALSDIFSRIFMIDPARRITISQLIKLLQKTFVLLKLRRKLIELKKIDNLSLQLQKIIFIQNIIAEINEVKFMSQSDLFISSYYLNKVCISIFKEKKQRISSVQNKILKLLTSLHLLSIELLKKHLSLSKIQIENEENGQKMNFEEYKEEYRLVVGQCFSEAHRNIQKFGIKVRLKLKILCCHSINKIFNRKNIQRYFKKCCIYDENQKSKNEQFSIGAFERWIQKSPSREILSILETLNQKMQGKA